MKHSEALGLVATIMAAFPRGEWPQSTQNTYAASLENFTFAEGRRAVEIIAATKDFPPSLAEIRREIIEERLGLPPEVEAWEMAMTHATARRPGAPKQKCIDCMGDGRAIGGGPGSCEPCHGLGELDELDLSLMPPIPDPIPAAVRSIGGWRAVRESSRPEFLRRDFIEAFRRLRSELVEHENLVALGARRDHRLVAAAAAALPPGDQP